MNDPKSEQSHDPVKVEKLTLAQIVGALTVGQLFSFLTVIVTVLGGTFTLGVNSSGLFSRESSANSLANGNAEEPDDGATQWQAKLAQTRAKERFLAINSTTLFNAMLVGEDLYSATGSPLESQAKAKLPKLKNDYQAVVKEMTLANEDTGERLATIVVDRSPGPAKLVFAHDDSTWMIPDFVTP